MGGKETWIDFILWNWMSGVCLNNLVQVIPIICSKNFKQIMFVISSESDDQY